MNFVVWLKEGEWGRGQLAEECGVGTAILCDIKMNAALILKFFFCVPAWEDGCSTGQTVKRAENDKVVNAVYKWF